MIRPVGQWLPGWALVGVLAGQFAVLYLPGSPEPGPELLPHLDKVVHLGLFAVPAFLLRRLTRAWWPVLLLAAHASLSEVIQHLAIPRRSGDPLDLLADLVGVLVGVTAAQWLRRAGEPRTAPGRRA